MTERFAAALVGAPFGLTGRLKIEPLSGEGGHLLGLKKVVLRLQTAKKEHPKAAPLPEKEFIIEEIFTSPLSVKLEGIDSPEAAKALRGAEILVPREQAAPLYEGEFYIEDLRGLEVVVEGRTAGTISDVVEGGGGFLVEVLLLSGEKRLVPFRNEFFGPVDPAAGRAELLNRWILE
jgi:16S rRNA processing protein RimM